MKDIARSEEISEKYLSLIIIPLKAQGLINTFRGAHSGYILGRDAQDITLREIIEPLEGDLGLVDCVNNASMCGRAGKCVTRDIWNEMSSIVRNYLDSITLYDLMKKQNRKRGAASDFTI